MVKRTATKIVAFGLAGVMLGAAATDEKGKLRDQLNDAAQAYASVAASSASASYSVVIGQIIGEEFSLEPVPGPISIDLGKLS